ncbi:fungal specific transcription factor [Colletotrichum orchidophilum]|uniref:Fungal specific transcription factor n=1 Tax=Colletotrichum orchidophilum TaxID=1209926 RepID=A0A1G4ARX3_9PEZI|nr:fungal specific transcription factor [Colletotrichum orchidophilum]OHE91924.1 fungal specific transcription factor [Colletotrichum orchidophilum]
MVASRSPDQPSAQKKRRRPALACEQCRRRKVRCDRNLPCNTCIRSKHALCTYTSQTKPAPRKSPKHGAEGTEGTIHTALRLPDPILPASQSLRTMRHPVTSTSSSAASSTPLAAHTRLENFRDPVHGSTNPNESGLGFPEPIAPTSRALSEASPATHDARNLDGHPLFTSDPSSGEHAGPADFGPWRPVNPTRPPAAVSVRAETASTPGSCPGSSSTVNSLVDRVKQLEQQLSDLTVKYGAREEDVTQPAPGFREGLRYSRGCVSKTRYFGQSHWMNAADMLYRLVNFARKFENRRSSELYIDLEKCKKLGRIIKARRTPSFSSISTGKSMPSRELADALINNYIRTFESIHRIIHVPTFKADYEKYWENPSEATDSFIITMQLCMGIGATMHDERFTLRYLAIQWFWEAMFWLITPCEKSKMTISGLQIRCLMHYLRQTANIGCDLTWISAGALIRTAMYMGLHRDPKSIIKMSPYRAEMRRRLWVTILEITLQTSIDSGGPPLISMDDFDTEIPANLDDEQLVEDGDSTFPVPRDPGTHTQMTVPLAVFETFATRLAVTKRVNEFRSDTVYEETLRHSNELSKSLQKMMQQLKAHPAVTSFQLRYVQFLNYRLFFALHHQIAPLAQRNPVYYFSRKMVVDTALRLCEVAFLSPDKSGTGATVKPATPSEVDFHRLTINGAGFYRSIPFQGIMTLGLELINTKEEEARNGYSVIYSGAEDQLRSILSAAYDWSRDRILSGETNIKGHALSVLLIAHIHGLEQGVSDDKIEEFFEDACRERVKECYDLLKDLAGGDLLEEGVSMPDVHDLDMDFEAGVDMLGDWDWGSMDNNGFGFSSIMNFNAMPEMFSQ